MIEKGKLEVVLYCYTVAAKFAKNTVAFYLSLTKFMAKKLNVNHVIDSLEIGTRNIHRNNIILNKIRRILSKFVD